MWVLKYPVEIQTESWFKTGDSESLHEWGEGKMELWRMDRILTERNKEDSAFEAVEQCNKRTGMES